MTNPAQEAAVAAAAAAVGALTEEIRRLMDKRPRQCREEADRARKLAAQHYDATILNIQQYREKLEVIKSQLELCRGS